MKILWVKSDFLHPTNRGGQIRTLEMLKCLHRKHEVHFIAFDDGKNPEGLRRSSEYCSRAYAVPHRVPPRRSLRFAGQLVEGLVSRLPVSVRRYTSGRMKRQIQWLLEQNQFDSLVCDFLFPAMNIPDLSGCVLFQHNVESVIWRRHVQQASGPAKRAYFRLQARRMEILERAVCRKAGHIVAVSDVDRDTMRKMFGVERVDAKLPVVSTSIGAEGLPVEDGVHLYLADSAEQFAQRCLELLKDADKRIQLADRAWDLVSSQFSWEAVTRDFETILLNGPRPTSAGH